MERKYSVSEIDRMRAAVAKMNPLTGQLWYGSNGPTPETRAAIDSHDRIVEDKLRTYMLAGVDTDELEAQAHQLKSEK